jgi:hypothetical protein
MLLVTAGIILAAGCHNTDKNSGVKAKSSSKVLPLKTSGAKILNSENKPVLLRGVNVASLEWTSDGNGQVPETVRVAIEDWHVNIIRLPLSQDRWFGKAPEQNDMCEPYRALIKQVFDYCGSKGCYIILDLHWSDANQWGQNIGQQPMPDRNSVTFWKDFAAVYANNPAVLFDLYNEPFGTSWDIWLNGGTVTSRSGRTGQKAITYQAAGMQTLLDTIRSTGAKNVVVAGGLDYAYDFNGILDGRELKDPTGNGVIYANHVYDNKGDSVFTWIAKMEKASAKLPIIIGEFGGSGGPNRRRGWWGQSPSTAMGDDWLLHILQAIQDHNWAFTAWDLHPEAGPTLISDWNYTPTPDFGVYVKQLLVEGKLPRYTPPDISKIAKESATTLPESARFGGSELYGDWQIGTEPNDRQSSVLSFSGDSDGRLVGQWINFRGYSELKDVRFKDKSVSFTQAVQFNKEEYKANFAGTIEGDKLSGIFKHGGSQDKIQGSRGKRLPLAVGSWEMKYKINDLDITATLVIKTDTNGTFSADWFSSMGEHHITDVNYEQGKLTFKRQSKIQDREFDSAFEGAINPQTGILSGVFKSERGEVPAEGKRIGSDLIGIWTLDVTSGFGSSRQRLKVNQDMSGMYGVNPIEKVNLEGDKVSFKMVSEFGRRRFEMNFEGKLTDSTLTGELKTSRGAQQVSGKKIATVF